VRLLRKPTASIPAPNVSAADSSQKEKKSRFLPSLHRRPDVVDNKLQTQSDAFVLLDEGTPTSSPKNGAIPWEDDAVTVPVAESRRKLLLPHGMNGRPVYLEDTGEKIGVVVDSIIDKEHNLVGYKIKDTKSETILSFTLNQFLEDKEGLIFIPSWYNRGVKTVEKLEFKDRITPELQCLVMDHTVSPEELYQIFVRHDDTLTNYLVEAAGLRDQLMQRLAVLERERMALKESLMDITEKRLIQDIDRHEFSDIVTEHRRKVNVLDTNIKKSKDLLDRLQKTSFGSLSLALHASQIMTSNQPTTNQTSTPSADVTYQEKYSQLRQQYTKLQEGYDELKAAVDRLLSTSDP